MNYLKARQAKQSNKFGTCCSLFILQVNTTAYHLGVETILHLCLGTGDWSAPQLCVEGIYQVPFVYYANRYMQCRRKHRYKVNFNYITAIMDHFEYKIETEKVPNDDGTAQSYYLKQVSCIDIWTNASGLQLQVFMKDLPNFRNRKTSMSVFSSNLFNVVNVFTRLATE